MTFVAFMFLAIPASAGMYYLPTANLGFMDDHTARVRHAHTIDGRNANAPCSAA